MGAGLSATYIVLSAIAGIVYFAVGRAVMARRPGGQARAAGTSFAAWWYGLAGLQLASVVSFAADRAGLWTLPAYMAYIHMLVFLLVVMLAALVYYFAYLFTGRQGAWKPILGSYLVFWLLYVYQVAVSDPIALTSGITGPEIEYATGVADSPIGAILGLLLLLPAILGAIGYVSLVFKVQDPSQRFRILAIAGAFIVWFSTSLLVGQTAFATSQAWIVISPVIAVAAATLVFVAFRPPSWLRSRLGLRGFGETAP